MRKEGQMEMRYKLHHTGAVMPLYSFFSSMGADLNAQGGNWENALQAASLNGHDSIIRLVLAKGADVNAQRGTYGNALQAASYWGHDTIVLVLLEESAHVNAKGGWLGSALKAARSEDPVGVPRHRGRDLTMKLLLGHGAIDDGVGEAGSETGKGENIEERAEK